MWPPAYPQPGGGQFYDHAWNIDFDNNPDADDMFVRPTPVPGYASYLAAPNNRSATHAMRVPVYEAYLGPDRDGMYYHPDFDPALNHAEVPYLEDDADSEDDAEFEIDSEYEDDQDGENRPDADDVSAHAAPAPRPSSPPLATLRTEDFPPLRGTGLGKTTVLIRKRPQAPQPPLDDNDEKYIVIERIANAIPRPSIMGPPPRPISGTHVKLKTGKKIKLNPENHANGLPPVIYPRKNRSESVVREKKKPSDCFGLSPPFLPAPTQFDFASTGMGNVSLPHTTTRPLMARPRGAETLSTAIAKRVVDDASRCSVMGLPPPPRPKSHHLEVFDTRNESRASHASHYPTIIMSPPPPRSRQLRDTEPFQAAGISVKVNLLADPLPDYSFPYEAGQWNRGNVNSSIASSSPSGDVGPPPHLSISFSHDLGYLNRGNMIPSNASSSPSGDMGPPPPPKRQRLTDIFPSSRQLSGRGDAAKLPGVPDNKHDQWRLHAPKNLQKAEELGEGLLWKGGML
jgi:hypothetical protein